ncbi:hypothetical protein L6452_34185 [Arctium lappa]|uniref:Uncharacterized protein n=1 Tax=Arctium lappa TaxID=4217 RepID=A0ACB8YLQ3_ARCLA|nr:hypothetical protein L6452_34185 [Arctium lappa]
MYDVGDDEFYDNIVQVKRPKCNKEVERLDGWIKYLLNNGIIEPLRLAHLLLAKATFVSDEIHEGSGVDLDETDFGHFHQADD